MREPANVQCGLDRSFDRGPPRINATRYCHLAANVLINAKWRRIMYAQPIETRSLGSTPASSVITDAEAGAMFRAAVNLFALWKLTDHQAATLLDLKDRSYGRWKAGETGHWGRDIKARLSNIMGIHKALRIIFHEPQRCYDWIRAPNGLFSGKSALDVMLNGDLADLMRIRRYLDSERGGW
jgi:hypothetical protein